MRPFTRKLSFVILASLLTVLLAACGGEDARTAEDVPPEAIALMGDTEIPRAEFDALMARAEQNYEAQDRPFPKIGTPEYQDLKTRAVGFLVQRYQFREEAEELNVEVSKEDVDAKLEEIKEQAFEGDDEKFNEALEQEGLTLEQAREEVRDRLLQERVYETVTEDVEVTDEDVQAYYEENKQQFTQPASRDVRHILVKGKAKADELHAELENGGNFAQLARQHSTDTATKKAGGKLPVTKGTTVPAFDKVAFELDTNEVSAPVKTTFGWHIIKPISDVQPEEATPLEEVEESIREQLLQQKRNEALEGWLKEIEEKYHEETVFAAGFEPPQPEGDGEGENGEPAETEPATDE